ncbi:MAG: LysR substrate-binding domain-containing protein [Sphingomonadaceae bacterium]|uniref:LysR substrate-binding domain-containing protein n=1 Tax=Thermaurantiacus sp. TaxID=2820283 RepID=UPI00298ED2FB|nr:LysR substrate-binding domain-containing protein [Thermaurantiacus sp.]MCS6986954.1 LysR substrate-binding domain-containing protein [Sphingomonadaceae bacterium]MDW8415446.1 LysR substrate-binding domain-containing protein [Thermaurantiacus sp.]
MRRSLLPLNALRVFDAAARTLSFARAADELAVTPAAVGQQIRALEETLGVILFRRTPRGLELTAEAEAALPALKAGFARLEEAVQTLQAGQGPGRLTLAVARGALRHWLSPRLSRWMAEHPETQVRILPLDGPVDFSGLNLDLALSFGPPPDAEGVFGRKLADEVLVPVARPGAPEREVHWRSVDAARAGPGAILVADAGAALDWALAGLGVARVPRTLAEAALAAGEVAQVGPAEPIAEAYWLCAPEPQWKSPKVRAFVEALLKT